MNVINSSCAPADRKQRNNWTDIDWARCEAAVQKLQGRIVKAQKLLPTRKLVLSPT